MTIRHNPPIEIEVSRGPVVESRHLVDAVVMDAAGRVHSIHGEIDRPVFPRSAIKGLQALPLVESGAADRFGLQPRHLALACASHNGEDMHRAVAAEALTACGLDGRCLECGAHWPSLKHDQDRLVREGREPDALYNNCSGKHSGFLCLAVHEGHDPSGYVRADHAVQGRIAEVLTETTGHRHEAANRGIDGCSIPTYAIPLSGLAAAFARFGTAEGGGPLRSAAMRRLRDACFAHPEMVAGTGRADTAIMTVLKGRAFTKTGAEGVFIAALPEQGLGIALKARDGATRAAEAAILRLLESILELEEDDISALKGFRQPILRNWNGIEVGRVS